MSFRETLSRQLRAIQERNLEELAATAEADDLAVAVLRLDYREPPQTRTESFLTLVFRREGTEWRMVQDQNTPIKPRQG